MYVLFQLQGDLLFCMSGSGYVCVCVRVRVRVRAWVRCQTKS